MRRIWSAAAIVAVIVVALQVWTILAIRQLGQMARELQRPDTFREIKEQLDTIRGQLQVPIIPGMGTIVVGGYAAKALDYSINLPQADAIDESLRFVDLYESRFVQSNFDALTGADLHLIPTPANLPYVPGKAKLFHPWSWYLNITQVGDHIAHFGLNQRNQTVQAQLLDLLKENVARDTNGGIYLSYPMHWVWHGHAGVTDFAPGWVSGFGNGVVLAGLSRLYYLTKNEEVRTLMDGIFRSYVNIRVSEAQTTPWVAHVDSGGYYWIEEYPLPKDPQDHVLNGFIAGIQGIYAYYTVTQSAEALTVLRAAITTVQAHIGRYRRPGEVNNYYDGAYLADYFPKRTVAMAEWLFRVTGVQYFRTMADAFKTDQSYWFD
jgi:hypothetical protein